MKTLFKRNFKILISILFISIVTLTGCTASLNNKNNANDNDKSMELTIYNGRREKFIIPLGVTRVQWMAMYYLLKYGDMSQKELGERMDIKESTVARLLDRMESEDLIIRIQTKEDRRIKYIKLTPKGKEKIEELLPEGQKMSEFFSIGITEDEIEVFKRVLQKFEENIS